MTKSVLLFPDSVIPMYHLMICSPTPGTVFVLYLDPRCDDIFLHPPVFRPVYCCVTYVLMFCFVFLVRLCVFCFVLRHLCDFCLSNLIALCFVLVRASLCGVVVAMLLTGNGTDARRAADRTVLEVRHQEPKRWSASRKWWGVRIEEPLGVRLRMNSCHCWCM